MTPQFKNFLETRKRIGDALDGQGYDIKEKGRRSWRIDHDGVTQRQIDIVLRDSWLSFREPLGGAPEMVQGAEMVREDSVSYAVPEASDSSGPQKADPDPMGTPDPIGTMELCPSARDPWSLVSAALFTTSRGKVAMDPADGSLRLREDVPLGDGLDLSAACRDAVSGFSAARSKLIELHNPAVHHKTSGQIDSDTAQRVPETGQHELAKAVESEDTLEDLCADTGWAWSTRSDGNAVAALDVPFGVHHAVLAAVSGCGYRLAVELGELRSPCDEVRSAVAVFLLMVNELVRYARAGAVATGKGIKTFLEVCFVERPSAVLFDEALCALSVGVRFCDRELRALGEKGVARRYLEIRGMSPNGQDPSRGRVSVNNPDREEVSDV
ncbi:MAG: hypothetical protein JSW50_12290 [Candidatus Latescibacterota bacterium]|nr:MAG: hypothetical protein JSW50_12290 [Candidatus Latescibacterota bacterium]